MIRNVIKLGTASALALSLVVGTAYAADRNAPTPEQVAKAIQAAEALQASTNASLQKLPAPTTRKEERVQLKIERLVQESADKIEKAKNKSQISVTYSPKRVEHNLSESLKLATRARDQLQKANNMKDDNL